MSAVRPLVGRVARLPELFQEGYLALIRPLVGAVSALVVVVVMYSGLVPIGPNPGDAAMMVVAFSAGFSERLVMRSVERASEFASGTKGEGH